MKVNILALALYGAMVSFYSNAQDTSQSDASTLDAINVVGTGSTRTTAAITSNYIESQAPGVTPQSLLADMPGVNVQMSDPYGMYELNDRMTVRGFSSTQLGMSIDGVPFYNSLAEGGTIAHYILTENMATAEMSPGSGDVTQPAMSALGGSIRYLSRRPSQEFGGKISETVGKFGFNRAYVGIDTGRLWENGPTAYIAAARNRVYQWENYEVVKGQGTLEADHVEAKIRQDWDKGSLEFYYSFDDRSNWDTKNVDLYTMKPVASGELYPNPVDDPTLWAGYWRNGTRDYLYYLKGEFFIKDNLTLKVTPYHNNHDYWLWYGVGASSAQSAYDQAISAIPGRTDVVAPNGKTAQRLSTRGGKRTGVTSSLTWEAGSNTFEVGAWFEDNDYSYWYPLQNSDPETGEILTDQVISITSDFDVNTKVSQFFLKDTIRLMDDRLTVQAGAKALHVDRDFNGYATIGDFNKQTPRSVSTKYKDWFQPQLGFTWKFNDAVEGFINYAENFSAVTVSALTSVIYNPNIKPEQSRNWDLGIRIQGDDWSGFIAAYKSKYIDRIISLSSYDRLSTSQGSTYLNVNGVDTVGLEVSADWNPLPAWEFTSSLSYSKSTFDGDYYAFDSQGYQNILVPVDGNDLPDQPRFQGNVNAFYNKRHISANVGVQYMGSRYGDAMNTLKVPNYTLVNAGISYKGLEGEKLERVTFRLNVYNAFDKVYISSISSNQSSGTFKRGYPRALYGSVEYKF